MRTTTFSLSRQLRVVGLLAALAMLGTSAWMATEALADSVHPQNVRIGKQRYRFWQTRWMHAVKIYWEQPIRSRQNATTGINWCKAKDTLPANWDTQDNRALRTDSMCAEAPKYGSLGWTMPNNRISINQNEYWRKGTKGWDIGDLLDSGRWIISINFWNGWSAHHHGGNHTSLQLITLDPKSEERRSTPVNNNPGQLPRGPGRR